MFSLCLSKSSSFKTFSFIEKVNSVFFRSIILHDQSAKQDLLVAAKCVISCCGYLFSSFFTRTHMSFTVNESEMKRKLMTWEHPKWKKILLCRVHVVRYFIFWFSSPHPSSFNESEELRRTKSIRWQSARVFFASLLVISLMQGVYDYRLTGFCAMLYDDLWRDAESSRCGLWHLNCA